MAEYVTITAIESRQEASSARTYFFSTGSEFVYLPGQYVAVKLEGVEDPRGPQRPFTLSTSPTEKDRIGITVKETGSPFKEALHEIAEQGGELEGRLRMRGPMGNFTLDSDRSAIMLAGGIGITPFRSMIRYIADKSYNLPVVLIYSNDTPEDIVFRDELDNLAEQSKWLTVCHTITQPADAVDTWSGRTGRINGDFIRKQAAHLKSPVYYVCGPPAMVTAMCGIVIDELRTPKSDLMFEKFTGY